MDTEIDRTTSLGFWSFAEEYVNAAKAVQKSVGNSISMPAYFLVGHSIELSLKAFLLGRGVPLSELRSRKKYGHDLEKLLQEARRRRLGREVKLSKKEVLSIRLLNYEYNSKLLEYIEIGSTKLPTYVFLESIAIKLVMGLKYYCYQKTCKKSLRRGKRN
jgi:hypothetical protein